MYMTEEIEREYGKPIRELSTDAPLSWYIARALRQGARSEAEWFWETGELVWC